MIRKNYFIFLMTAALFLLSSTIIFAQGTPIKGKIQMKAADGKVTPVEGATVEFYRTDVATGKLAAVKTDAQGMYTSESAPSGQVFAIVVSAPNANPALSLNVKAGQTLNLDLIAGSGSVPSEQEVRDSVRINSLDPNSAEGKKARADYEKQAAEANAKNEKAKASNETINRSLKEGNEAYNAKNYDVAIAKYDEGYKAAPDFLGSAPVLLNNKAQALRLRGYTSYTKSATDAANKASLMESAKKDLTDSIAAYQLTLDLVSKAPATDATAVKSKAAAQYGIAEAYRLLVGTKADPTKTKELTAATTEYAATETDAAAKTKTLVQVGDILRTSGDSADAATVYRKALESDPNNIDATGGLGLSLFDIGVSGNDKAQMQEGLNLMEKFSQNAPDTNPMKGDIKGAVEYLKTTEKMTAQPVGKPSKKKT